MKAAALALLLLQDVSSFEWKFKKGDAFDVSYSVRVKLEPENWKEFATALGETDVTLAFTATAAVDETDTEGTALVKLTFETARFGGTYLGGKVEYVFERGTPLRDVVAKSEAAARLGEAVKDLTDITKNPTEIVIDSYGLAQIRGILPEAFRLGLGEKSPIGVLLPRRGAAVGGGWSEETELLGGTYKVLEASVKGKARHTFESKDGSVAKIRSEVEGRSEAKDLTVSAKGSATSLFDLAAGNLKGTQGTREFRFEFPAGDEKAAVKASIAWSLDVKRK